MIRSRFCVLLAAAVGVCVVAEGRASSALEPQANLSVKALTAAATAYLTEYQKQLSFLIADERSTQDVFDRDGLRTATRTTSGELFVTFLPADRAWISVHDTSDVDGRTVENREDIRHLLQREPMSGVARLLVQTNARFNIGSIVRNFNEPTLALLVLETRRRSQFKFDRRAVDQQGDATVVTIGFKETERPTLVRGQDGSDVFSTGELSVEAGTGRIRRTFIQLRYGPVMAQLTTVYGYDPNVNVWVPHSFTERYERAKDVPEAVVCGSTYTNYRRFDVVVTIK